MNRFFGSRYRTPHRDEIILPTVISGVQHKLYFNWNYLRSSCGPPCLTSDKNIFTRYPCNIVSYYRYPGRLSLRPFSVFFAFQLHPLIIRVLVNFKFTVFIGVWNITIIRVSITILLHIWYTWQYINNRTVFGKGNLCEVSRQNVYIVNLHL